MKEQQQHQKIVRKMARKTILDAINWQNEKESAKGNKV